MAFCVYCGARLRDIDRFCGSCGNRVVANGEAAPAAEFPVYAPAAEPVFTPAAEPVCNPAPDPIYTSALPAWEAYPVTEPAFAAPAKPVAEPEAWSASETAVPSAPEPPAKAPAAAGTYDMDEAEFFSLFAELQSAPEQNAAPLETEGEMPREEAPLPPPEQAIPVAEQVISAAEPVIPVAEPVEPAAPEESVFAPASGFDFAADREPVKPQSVPSAFPAFERPVSQLSAEDYPKTYAFDREEAPPTGKATVAERYEKPNKAHSPKPRPAQPRKRGALRVIASVLICILLLTALAPLFTLVTARNSLRQETFLSMLRRVDLDRIPIGQLDPVYGDDKDLSVADALCEGINEMVSDTVNSENWTHLTPKSLNRLLRETTFPEFIAEQLEKLITALLQGDQTFGIDPEDLENVLRENLSFITADMDLLLEEEDIVKAARQVAQAGGLNEISLYSDMDEEVEEALAVARMTLSAEALIPVIVAVAVLVGLLFLANGKQPLYALRDLGIVAVLATAVPLLAIGGCRVLIAQTAGKEALAYIVGIVVSCMLESAFVLYICLFAAGVALLILNGVVRAARKKRSRA